MSMKKDEYVSLLEQAVVSTSGPMKAGKGSGDFSKTGPEGGLDYKGLPVDGDKILNWEGDGDQHTHKTLGDIDDLVKTITKNKYGEDKTKHEWTDVSPISMLEQDDDLKDAESEKEDDEDKEDEGKKDEGEKEEDELDVDEELEEGFSDLNFTNVESDVISKLIKEMTMLEQEEDLLESDDLDDEPINSPDLDLMMDDI